MNSITLHNLEDSLYAMLKETARKEGKSMNRAIKDLLTEAVGLERKAGKGGIRKGVYAELCGAMSRKELGKMEEAEEESDVTDEKDWK